LSSGYARQRLFGFGFGVVVAAEAWPPAATSKLNAIAQTAAMRKTPDAELGPQILIASLRWTGFMAQRFDASL
jgi:hypothetical protein